MKLLANDELDKTAWDHCIKNSPQGLIYARSWYLDHLCPQWKALVGDGYSWVMPITENRKFGIRYLYQPSFTQQLGVFSVSLDVVVPWEAIRMFLEKRYSFWEISLHPGTPPAFMKNMVVKKANNFLLDLSAEYEKGTLAYAGVLKKNLKRSKHANLAYSPGLLPQECISLYSAYYGRRIAHVRKREYDAFAELCNMLEIEKDVFCRKAVNSRNELMAIILLLCDGKKLYNIMNVTLERGKRSQSNHFLIDCVAREFCGRGLLLDLEGSDLPGVKKFYESFGAFNQPYFQVKHNKLVWPLRLLK